MQRRFGQVALRAAHHNGLLVAIVAIFGAALVARLPMQLQQDGWLSLVGGREIAQFGLGSIGDLTRWSDGVRWIDQQWLGQLVLYELAVVGGVKLALLVHAVLVMSAFCAALVIARRGATARAVAWTAAVATVLVIEGSWQMRAQSFAYPLFIAVLTLLIFDSRTPSARVFLVLPLLVLWANLHGSVVLGASLVCLRALVFLVVECRGKHAAACWRRGVVLLIAPVVCLFVSPYGLALFGYYRDTLLNREFARLVSEWQAPTPELMTIPLYVVAVVGTWLVARFRGRLTAFEMLAFVVTGVAAFLAVRNFAWFGFAALVILPRAVDPVLRKEQSNPPEGLNLALSLVSVTALLAIVGLVAARPSSWFQRGYPRAASDKVALLARDDASLGIFSDVRYADWLLWEHPELRNRVAYDARFELLSSRQLLALYHWQNQSTVRWREAARGYRLVVIDRKDDGRAERELLRTRGTRRVFADPDLAVLIRPEA